MIPSIKVVHQLLLSTALYVVLAAMGTTGVYAEPEPLGTPSSSAASPASTVPPSVANSIATPAIDPAAIELLTESRNAYKNLKAFSANIKGDRMTGFVAWEKPNKFRFESTLPDPSGKLTQTAAASDGKNGILVPYFDPKHFYRSTAGRTFLFNAYDETCMYRITASSILVGSVPFYLDSLLNKSPKGELVQKLVSLQLGAPAEADGTAIDVVNGVQTVSEGTKRYEYRVTLSIGHKDHLIRTLDESITRTDPGGAKHPGHARMTEEYTNVTVADSLPDSVFTYTPPPGLTLGSAQALAKEEVDARTLYDRRLIVGARPFAFVAVDLKGKRFDLSQYRGKVLVMDFWATWCGPCCEELPNVVATYRKYHQRGVDVVGISLDNDKSDLTDYIRQNRIPYRNVFDGKGWKSSVASLYDVRGIPFALVIGRDGRIAAVDVRGSGLQTAVQKALAE